MVASWDPQRRYASHSVLMDSNDASPQLPIRTHTVAIGTPSSGVPQSMDPQDNQLGQVLVSSVTNDLLVVIRHLHHRHNQLPTTTVRLLRHHVYNTSTSTTLRPLHHHVLYSTSSTTARLFLHRVFYTTTTTDMMY